MSLGQKIKKLRLSKKLSQKEISLNTDIDRSQYSRIENDKVEPTLASLRKIAQVLDVEVAYLLSKDEDPFDIESFDKSLVERVKLIDRLEEKHQKAIFTIIDIALANRKLKNILADAATVAA